MPSKARNKLLSVFQRYRPALRREIGRIVKPDDIEDILQETFIRSYVASERNDIRHPRSFMLRTARNLALNEVTSASSQRTRIEDFSSSEVLPLTDSVEAQCESEERFLVFCRAVRLLPAQCRRVFVLKKVYGLGQREIAEYLGISESTVEKHVAKGLLMCKASMEKMGYEARTAARRGRSQ